MTPLGNRIQSLDYIAVVVVVVFVFVTYDLES